LSYAARLQRFRVPLGFVMAALYLTFAPQYATPLTVAVGGAIAFVVGSLLLINSQGAPFLEISLVAIAAMTAVFLGFFLVLVAAVLRLRQKRVSTGREGLLGAPGVVRRALEPGAEGVVLTQGELWRAIAADDRLDPGERVVVEAVDGLLLTVRRASDVAPAPRRPA